MTAVTALRFSEESKGLSSPLTDTDKEIAGGLRKCRRKRPHALVVRLKRVYCLWIAYLPPWVFFTFLVFFFPFREKSVHEPGVDLNSSLTTIDWLASVTPKVSGTLYFFRIFFLLLSFSLFTPFSPSFPGFIDSARFRESPRATRNLIIRTRRWLLWQSLRKWYERKT